MSSPTPKQPHLHKNSKKGQKPRPGPKTGPRKQKNKIKFGDLPNRTVIRSEGKTTLDMVRQRAHDNYGLSVKPDALNTVTSNKMIEPITLSNDPFFGSIVYLFKSQLILRFYSHISRNFRIASRISRLLRGFKLFVSGYNNYVFRRDAIINKHA